MSTAMFNSYVELPEGNIPSNPIKPPFSCGFPLVFLSFPVVLTTTSPWFLNRGGNPIGLLIWNDQHRGGCHKTACRGAAEPGNQPAGSTAEASSQPKRGKSISNHIFGILWEGHVSLCKMVEPVGKWFLKLDEWLARRFKIHSSEMCWNVYICIIYLRLLVLNML